jgi:hypothetical protein
VSDRTIEDSLNAAESLCHEALAGDTPPVRLTVGRK